MAREPRFGNLVIFERGANGENCDVCAHSLIEGDVIIGNNVTIKSGVYLWDAIRIEDNVFIGPNATFANDKFPRSKQYPDAFQSILVKKGADLVPMLPFCQALLLVNMLWWGRGL